MWNPPVAEAHLQTKTGSLSAQGFGEKRVVVELKKVIIAGASFCFTSEDEHL